MTEPIPEQPGTSVDTKDTSVDKTASPTQSPPPSEAKVSSTTSEKKEAPSSGQRIEPQPAKNVVRGAPPAPSSKEPTRGTEGTEVRQRKSPARLTGFLTNYLIN